MTTCSAMRSRMLRVNAGEPRRKRQIILLLSAILIPTAVLITFAIRLSRQDAELAEKRVADERRDALDQLRRELSARLEAIKLRELSRLSGESFPATAPRGDFPVLFVAALVQNRLVLPWDTPPRPETPSSQVAQYQKQGEEREFLGDDFSGAYAAYDQAHVAGRNPADQCAATLSKARVLVKADIKPEAAALYRSMLDECGSVQDADGMTFGLYAAERLISLDLDVKPARQYLINRVRSLRWLPPVQTYLMRSLLQDATDPDAKRASDALNSEIHDVEQILALANDLNRLGRIDFPFHASPGKSVWLAYGDEPWFVTMTSTASFALPVIMAISSRKVSPPGVTFLAGKTEKSAPLGEGFVDLEVEWPAGRFVPATSVPRALYAGGIGLILGVTFLAGYLLLRDVSREMEVAEMRSHFVASVSHELKTPLTAIRMFAETLALGRTRDEKARSEYLETIVDESERLARLVDNVLDFSKIEQGKKIYRMRPTALAEVVRSAARAMRYPLSQQGFDLNVSVDERLPRLSADPDALEQAILNLLSNAMKYSKTSKQI